MPFSKIVVRGVHAWCKLSVRPPGVGAFSASVGLRGKDRFTSGGGFNGSARSLMSEGYGVVLGLRRARKPERPPELSGSGSWLPGIRLGPSKRLLLTRWIVVR